MKKSLKVVDKKRDAGIPILTEKWLHQTLKTQDKGMLENDFYKTLKREKSNVFIFY